MAQLVERPTEKPGTILMWVRVPGAARDFPPRESTSSADSLTVSVQTLCANAMHQHLCAHSKSQTAVPLLLFGHTKILHSLVGMGSAAFVAAVPYPSKATQISCEAQQRGTKQNGQGKKYYSK